MRAYTPDPNVPHCPDCGSRHYPGTTNDGRSVWCRGTPVYGIVEEGKRAAAHRAAQARADAEERQYIDDRVARSERTRSRWRANAERELNAVRLRSLVRTRLRIEHAFRVRSMRPPIDPNTESGTIPDRF